MLPDELLMTDKQGVRVAKTYSYQPVRVKVLGGLERRHGRHSLSGSGKRAMRDRMPTRRQVLGTGMIGLGLTLPLALPLTSVVGAQGSIEGAKIDFPYPTFPYTTIARMQSTADSTSCPIGTPADVAEPDSPYGSTALQ